MSHRTLNHTKRHHMPNNFIGKKPKAQRPIVLIAPVKEVQVATFTKVHPNQALIDRIKARAHDYCLPGFDAKDAQLYVLRAKYPAS